MPPKSFTCYVCGQEVSKPKSVMTPKGRMCRSHEGASEILAQKQTREVNKLKKQIEKPKKQKPKETLEQIVPKCSCCGKIGIRQDDFYFRMSVAMSKAKLSGILTHFLDPDFVNKIKPFIKSPDVKDDRELTCLFVISTKENPLVNKHLCYDARFAADMLGVAMVCPGCLKKYQVKVPESKFGKDIPPDKFLSSLHMLGAVVGPVIEDQASGELLAEAEKN